MHIFTTRVFTYIESAVFVYYLPKWPPPFVGRGPADGSEGGTQATLPGNLKQTESHSRPGFRIVLYTDDVLKNVMFEFEVMFALAQWDVIFKDYATNNRDPVIEGDSVTGPGLLVVRYKAVLIDRLESGASKKKVIGIQRIEGSPDVERTRIVSLRQSPAPSNPPFPRQNWSGTQKIGRDAELSAIWCSSAITVFSSESRWPPRWPWFIVRWRGARIAMDRAWKFESGLKETSGSNTSWIWFKF